MTPEHEIPMQGTPYDRARLVAHAFGLLHDIHDGYGKHYSSQCCCRVLRSAFEAKPECSSFPELRQAVEGLVLEDRQREYAGDLFEKLRQVCDAQA
jgi:hypothetical protein